MITFQLIRWWLRDRTAALRRDPDRGDINSRYVVWAAALPVLTIVAVLVIFMVTGLHWTGTGLRYGGN